MLSRDAAAVVMATCEPDVYLLRQLYVACTVAVAARRRRPFKSRRQRIAVVLQIP